LDKKKKIICLSKIDVLDESAKKDLRKIKFRAKETKTHYISSVTGEGIKELKNLLWDMVKKNFE